MSYFPPYLARLQDLKLWQGNYDHLLQKQNSNVLGSIEGLSEIDSSAPVSPRNPGKHKVKDWDKQIISPTKPFEQLLEEKLQEDQPVQTLKKPKKPFLRKGSGLVRYNCYKPGIKSNKSNTKCRLTQQKQTSPKSRNSPSSTPRNKHSSKKNTAINDDIGLECNLNAASLKIPDVINKPKATWCSIMSKKEYIDDTDKTNGTILKRLNQFALTNFLQKSPKKNGSPKKSKNPVDINYSNDIPSSKSIFEYTADKDLKVFETLEERVEHSSFSSNNSSIVRLLSSTPNKKKLKPSKSPILEERHSPDNSKCNNEPHKKLQELDQKQLVLHDFLINLRKYVDDKDVQVDFTESASEKKNCSPNTSFSDNWSSNTENREQSASSFYTDFENTFKNLTNQVDVGVNTSFNKTADQTVQTSGSCEHCQRLQNKLDQLKKDIPNIQAEKAKVCDFAKDLEKKKDELKREIERMKIQYEDSISDLRSELRTEKKKYEKEKAIFDMYIKESQNRPSKKEREEVTNLKKELIDIKELLKLKETKNGATQARLRTQVKQLEKERNELKTAVENLQKENAKLNASKKIGRPSEVKMLHEINRNLTKLTTEALKNQLTKSPRTFRKEDEEVILSEDSLNKSSKDILDIKNRELEKQYEDMFGQLENHFQNPKEKISNLNDSKPGKTQKVFPDGSKEIKYNNGNTKTISPDGNTIIIQYYNGDIKETNLSENIMKYYYIENSTWHTQYGDGTELLEYSNGQKEKKYTDGKKEVTCPDGTFLTKSPDGTEEVIYPDGSKLIKNTNGEKIILLPNSQKEIHTNEHKRREYPDGTVKILYSDGTQETRYTSGRVRIKDPNGILIMDK